MYKSNSIRVYIASPYTKGDVAMNVKRQLDVSDILMTLGFVPFVPLLSHFQHMHNPRPYQDWLELDLEWIYSCDAVLRLPGDSFGAQREVEFAEKHSINVFYEIHKLCEHFSVDFNSKFPFTKGYDTNGISTKMREIGFQEVQKDADGISPKNKD